METRIWQSILKERIFKNSKYDIIRIFLGTKNLPTMKAKPVLVRSNHLFWVWK